MKKWTLFIAAGVVGLAIGILVYGLIYALKPGSGQPASKTVTLKRGLTFKEIAQTLESEGIIRGADRFVLLGQIVNAGSRIKAGEYCFDIPTSNWKVLTKIVRGHVKTYKVTIPEGYTLGQIGNLLEKNGIVSKEAFVKEASSPAIISRHTIDGPNLEGYLFPDTYGLAKESEPAMVIRSFLQRFRQIYTADMAERASGLGFSEREILTIASIIERETSDLTERPLVSAVIHNRLKKGIRLQSDPTVIYGIPNFNGNLTRNDLRRHSPYNTYLIPGLPPGPICNPGTSSITSALFPASVDYLYFVSKNDGTHKFSSTLKEHDEAVDKYQRRRRRPQRGKDRESVGEKATAIGQKPSVESREAEARSQGSE